MIEPPSSTATGCVHSGAAPMQSNAIRALTVCIVLMLSSIGLLAQENQALSPDSLPQANVPQGEIKGPFSWRSEIFPGTGRDYWLYVPRQYDGNQPACVLVVQDGLNRAREWRLPAVMDNLIHKKEMPITIGIFIDPGLVPALHDKAQPRFNRSFEYDSMGDRYVRFLVEEILPEVGKSYKLSGDPNDRAIAGASSGGICAFTAAWERPDQFRRVLSTIGTFVGLRGGNAYPMLIRKCEPKPIRVFLQDGKNDLNIYGGDWWIANQDMLSALKYAGYDVNHAWGDGGHDGRHAAAIMPEALRWLWRDYPQPIETPTPAGDRRVDILIPGEGWQLVSQGHRFTEGPAVNSEGEVFFTDIPNNRIHKIDLRGNVTVFVENSQRANGLMFSREGFLYACQSGSNRIVRYDKTANEEVILTDVPSNDLVVFPAGGYCTDPDHKKIWHFDSDGNRQVVDEGIEFPNGLIVSPDHTLLLVANTRGRFIYSFQIASDGKLNHKQEYGYLHVPDDGSDSGADGLTMDRDGRLYVATRLGIQVLDPLGRCNLIVSSPHTGWLSNAVFGGPELDTLFVTCGDRVYKRKLKATGVVPWQDPVMPPRPRL
jgi:sugar lactone lactonase YvrE/enterochelin esterase-like enzyme